MKVTWRLRMAAAQREVWTGAQLRRLLAERAGMSLSSASVSALLTRQPAQLKLSTLAALCTALECTPNDLLEVDTTPAAAVPPQPATPGDAAGQARTLDAAAVSRTEGTCRDCAQPRPLHAHGRCGPCDRRWRREAAKRPARDAGSRGCCGPAPGSAGAASARCGPASPRPRPGR